MIRSHFFLARQKDYQVTVDDKKETAEPNGYQEEYECPQVAPTDAVIKSYTVVIEAIDTPSASSAVTGLGWPGILASITVPSEVEITTFGDFVILELLYLLGIEVHRHPIRLI